MNHEITSELKSRFISLYKMALADDDFGVIELQTLYLFAEDRGVPKTELDRILSNPLEQEATIPADLNHRIAYLYDLATMILVDEVVTDDERNTLKKFCRKFEFLDENLESIADYLLQCVRENVSPEQIIKQLN